MNDARIAPSPEHHHRVRAARERLQQIAFWLEGCIPVPGTRWKIGLEPIIGLVPVVGDVIGFLLSTLIILEGIKLGAPAVLITRMVGITILDVLIGLVPVLGDLFDFAYKANRRNAQLLTRHLDGIEGKPARPSVLRRGVSLVLLAGMGLLLLWCTYRILSAFLH